MQQPGLPRGGVAPLRRPPPVCAAAMPAALFGALLLAVGLCSAPAHPSRARRRLGGPHRLRHRAHPGGCSRRFGEARHQPDRRARWLARLEPAPRVDRRLGADGPPCSPRSRPAAGGQEGAAGARNSWRRSRFPSAAAWPRSPRTTAPGSARSWNSARITSSRPASTPRTNHPFHLAYLWDNFRIYFLNPAPWKPGFPFVGAPAGSRSMPATPTRNSPSAPSLNVPLVWFALAAWPLARKAAAGSPS